MLMISRGKFQASCKKWIHFDLNQVRKFIFNVEAISKFHSSVKLMRTVTPAKQAVSNWPYWICCSFVIPGLTRNSVLFQCFTLLDAGSSPA